MEELLRYNKDNLIHDGVEEEGKVEKKEKESLITLIERVKMIYDPETLVDQELQQRKE